MLEFLYTGEFSVQLPSISAPVSGKTAPSPIRGAFGAPLLSPPPVSGFIAAVQTTNTSANLSTGGWGTPAARIPSFGTPPAVTETTTSANSSLFGRSSTTTTTPSQAPPSVPSFSGSSRSLFGAASPNASPNQTPIFPPNFSFGGGKITPVSSSSPNTDSSSASVSDSTDPLITLSLLYVIAEKYDIEPLKKVSKDKYETIVHSSWNNPHFVDSLRLIYDGTPETKRPDAFRSLVIATAAKNVSALLDRGEFTALLNERGDIATAILRESTEQSKVPATKKCTKNALHALHATHSPLFGSVSKNAPLLYKCVICELYIE